MTLHFFHRHHHDHVLVRVFAEQDGARTFNGELHFPRFPAEVWEAAKIELAKSGTVEPDKMK